MQESTTSKQHGKTWTSTPPYFPLDSGQVLRDAMGRSMEEMGIYSMLLALYWEGCCRLPPRERLAGMLHLKKKQLPALEAVLDAFFPDGVNDYLDQCRENVLKTSRRNSENAKKRHAQRGNLTGNEENLKRTEPGPEDF